MQEEKVTIKSYTNNDEEESMLDIFLTEKQSSATFKLVINKRYLSHNEDWVIDGIDSGELEELVTFLNKVIKTRKSKK